MRASFLIRWLQRARSYIPMLAILLAPNVLQIAIIVAFAVQLRERSTDANLGSLEISLIGAAIGAAGLSILQNFWIARNLNRFKTLEKQAERESLITHATRRQFYTQMQRQLQRERAINEVIKAIGRSLDLSAVFSTAVAEIAPLLQVDQLGIVQFLPEDKLWRNLAAHRTTDQIPNALGTEVPDENNAIAAQLKQLQTVQIADAVQQCQDSVNRVFAQQFPGAWLMVPIAIDGQVWGALTAIKLNRSEPWQAPDVDIAQTMADQLAIAIQQSQLYQQVKQANANLQHLAVIDGLTQVANRRYFNDQLAQEWQRMLRQQQPLSLIMCDVDYFKPYNDTYGHQAGDVCLQRIAMALKKVVKRPGDLIARYGGEEFAVVLPQTNLEGAVRVAESIRTVVENLQVPHRTSPAAPYVTISLGVTSRIPKSNFSVDKLIQLADQALYLAKSAGRNCYRLNPSPSRYLEQ